MTTHKINDREYLFFEVDKDAKYFTLTGSLHFQRRVWVEYRVFHASREALLAEFGVTKDYAILGLATELTEEQAKPICLNYISKKGGKEYFADYTAEIDDEISMWLFTAKESLNSLITSLGLNPERTLIIERKK